MLEEYFQEGGFLNQIYGENYHPRQGQIDYANFIKNNITHENLSNFIEKKVKDQSEKIPLFVIAEAGTGVGKTMGYMISVLEAIREIKEKIDFKYPFVISVSSKSLQEQIIGKDIPVLVDLYKEKFDIDLTYMLVKGKKNYVCMNEFNKMGTLAENDKRASAFVKKYASKIREYEGDLEKIDFNLSEYEYVDSIKAKSECQRGCRNKECFYKRRKEKARKCDILVTNHHFLLTTLINVENSIFPERSYYVIDECHKFGEIARGIVEEELSMIGFERLIKQFRKSKQEILEKINFWLKGEYNHIFTRYIMGKGFISSSTEIEDYCKKLKHNLEDCFQAMEQYLTDLIIWLRENFIEYCDLTKMNDSYRRKIGVERVTTEKKIKAKEAFTIETNLEKISKIYNKFHSGAKAQRYIAEFCDFHNEASSEMKLNSNGLEFGIGEIEEINTKLISNYNKNEKTYHLCNIQKEIGDIKNIKLVQGYINASDILQYYVWPRLAFVPVVFTSATISIDKKFDFFIKEHGISECESKSFKSPFDYKNQCSVKLYEKTIPVYAIDKMGFIKTQSAEIEKTLVSIPGNTLMLLTSYAALKELRLRLLNLSNMYDIYGQDEIQKDSILRRIKEWKQGDKKFIILGTSSFFEGVDISTLEHLIITSIPFKDMNDPWVDAKQELLGDRGFMEFLLPEAIATMKQMCGRLIRNENSKGTLSIMDSRLNTKGYGQKILNSLPQVAGNIELVDRTIINCVPAKPKRRLNVE